MRYTHLITLAVTLTAVTAFANTVTHIHTDESKELPESIIFSASKGDVTFSHTQHIESLKSEGCIPCHRNAKPKKGDIATRFDERVAHYFCRGCHKDKGLGPTKCHLCHNNKK